MIGQVYKFVALSTFLVELLSPCACKAQQELPTTVQIASAAILQDPRLEKTVSISARSIPLKSLLDQMAAQSGIAISMDDRDPASGYSVMANVDKISVGKMMNALYGLFSIHRGEWAWGRIGKPGSYQYTLHETAWAKNRTATYFRILNGLMTNYIAVLRKLAPMSMAERKPHRDELKRALYLDDGPALDFYFSDLWIWYEARFFFGALAESEQETVLNGGSATISLSALPHDIYDQFHQSYLLQNPSIMHPDGTSVKIPEPNTLRLYSTQVARGSDRVAPMILVSEGNSSVSWAGTSMLEFGVRQAIKHAWILPGDSFNDTSSKRVVSEVKDTDAIRIDKEQAAANAARFTRPHGTNPESSAKTVTNIASVLNLADRLEQLSAGSSTPVLALLPPRDPHGFISPAGKPLQEFLYDLEPDGLKRYFYKWRDGVLLVNYPTWFTESTPSISFSITSALHPDAAGQVSLAEWSKLMSSISDDQAEWFASTYGIKDIKRLRPCLLLLAKELDVAKRTGITLEDDTVNYFQTCSLLPRGLRKTDQGVRFRMEILNAKSSPSGGPAFRLEVRDSTNDSWITTATVPLPVYNPTIHQVPIAP